MSWASVYLGGTVSQRQRVASQDLELVDEMSRGLHSSVAVVIALEDLGEDAQVFGGRSREGVHQPQKVQRRHRFLVLWLLLLLFLIIFFLEVVQLELRDEDVLHPQQIRRRAPGLRNGHQIRRLRNVDELLLRRLLFSLPQPVLPARQVERGHGDARQMLGLRTHLGQEAVDVGDGVEEDVRGQIVPDFEAAEDVGGAVAHAASDAAGDFDLVGRAAEGSVARFGRQSGVEPGQGGADHAVVDEVNADNAVAAKRKGNHDF